MIWKKLLGSLMIITSSFIIFVGLTTSFNKSPYCEWLAEKRDSSNEYYVNKYIEEFKYPSGQCYNRFLKKRLLSNLIVLSFGIYLVSGKKWSDLWNY